MKKDSERQAITVSKETVDVLRVARQGNVMRFTLGQMATIAIMEKYGQQKPVQVAAPVVPATTISENIVKSAEMLLKHCGGKEIALKRISAIEPVAVRNQMREALESL